MDLVTVLNGSTGLNNVVDPLRVPFSKETGVAGLAEAVNVVIDDTGMISRRLGHTSVSAISSHSLFCDKGDCFVVQDRASDSALYRVNADYTLTGVRSGLAQGVRTSFCQLGASTYYSNGFQNGVITGGVSNPWPTYTHVGADTTREFYPAPIGLHLAIANGRMWIAEDNVIWASEPFAYGKFNLAKSFFQFGSSVRMIKPVSDGVWVSDGEATYFIEFGEKLDQYKLVKKSVVPAHEWSESIELVDLSLIVKSQPGLSATWSSNEGLCIGSATGILTILTKDRLIYPAGASGATVVDSNTVINTTY